CNEQYPSKQIIKDALKLKIPILIGTDCHKKEDIDNRLNRANNLLKRLR
ncbi:histidinol-phosphatase, partial [Candidatus Pacearchaeota archaeon CG06_land_8_20_14_3_00_35_12]